MHISLGTKCTKHIFGKCNYLVYLVTIIALCVFSVQ
jgi:hypothetical protein